LLLNGAAQFCGANGCEPSAVARTAREVILGPATEVVPKWVGTLLSGHSR